MNREILYQIAAASIIKEAAAMPAARISPEAFIICLRLAIKNHGQGVAKEVGDMLEEFAMEDIDVDDIIKKAKHG